MVAWFTACWRTDLLFQTRRGTHGCWPSQTVATCLSVANCLTQGAAAGRTCDFDENDHIALDTSATAGCCSSRAVLGPTLHVANSELSKGPVGVLGPAPFLLWRAVLSQYMATKHLCAAGMVVGIASMCESRFGPILTHEKAPAQRRST